MYIVTFPDSGLGPCKTSFIPSQPACKQSPLMFLFVPSLLHFSKKSVRVRTLWGDSPSLGEQLSSLAEGRLSEHAGWQARKSVDQGEAGIGMGQ